jgi:single-strand DNA-binding protein
MNRVNITGRLTKDPELRSLPSGEQVCDLRIAVDGAARSNNAGFLDVASYGNSGAAAAKTLTTGWLVAIDGRLQWREWNAEDGTKRQAVTIVGNVEFLAATNGHKRPADLRDADIPF